MSIVGRWIALGALFAPFAMHGCLLSQSHSEACSRETPTVPPPPLASVPDTARVSGNRLVLDASVWRNFEPAVDGDYPRRLIAVAQVRDVDSVAVSPRVSLEHVWILRASDWWSAEFTWEERPPTPPYQHERVARCGPEWPPYSLVDVIVRLRLSPDSTALLRRTGVTIEAPM
jgi:hypothetical protein